MQRYLKIEGKGWFFRKTSDSLAGPFPSRAKAKAAFAEWWPTTAKKTLVVSI